MAKASARTTSAQVCKIGEMTQKNSPSALWMPAIEFEMSWTPVFIRTPNNSHCIIRRIELTDHPSSKRLSVIGNDPSIAWSGQPKSVIED
jgi:hypothetical protein